MIPLSLSTGNFFKNGIDLSDFFFFFGSPMTVLSAPLGLPLFFNLGGNVTSRNSVGLHANSQEYNQITIQCYLDSHFHRQ